MGVPWNLEVGSTLESGGWEYLGIWRLGVPWNLEVGSTLEFGGWEYLGIWRLALGI
jgi:hypothetical protein